MTKVKSNRSGAVVAWTLAAAAVSGAVGFAQGQGQAKQAPAAPVKAPVALAASVRAETPELAGRYIAMIGGCNDCHTPNSHLGLDKVPENQWLTGSPVGFRGPWGTTYASNLRLFVADVKEDDFLAQMRARNDRPPMPWGSLHAMSDADLRALYRYVRSLGPAGKPAPEYVPPGQTPKTPYIPFEPVMPPK